MSLLKRIIREPLVQFLLIGGVIFAAYTYLPGRSEQETPRDRIVVTAGRIQQMAEIFARTWQRPPTAQELHGLINAYIKEEVYYREAVKLGLDRDDTLIRRRMQQKMEFLTEPSDDALVATDADLQNFLEANRSAFYVEPQLAFQQIFISRDKSERVSSDRAEDFLSKAKSLAPDADFRDLGDPTLLPNEIPLIPLSFIDRNFGEGFGERLASHPSDQWIGPIESSFGLHLVRITERRDGYVPPLDAVRKAVELKWQASKREAFRQAEYERLRDKYEFVLPSVQEIGGTTREPN